MCSKCGSLNSVGKAKVFTCHNRKCKAIMSRDENGAINIGWNAILKLMDYIVTPPKETLSDTPKDNPKGAPPKGGNDDPGDDPGQGGGNNSQTNVVAPKSRPSRARGRGRGRGRGSSSSRVVKDSDGGDGKSKENLHFRVVTTNTENHVVRSVEFAQVSLVFD